MKRTRVFELPCDEQLVPTPWVLLARLAAQVDSTHERLIGARRTADSAYNVLRRRPAVPVPPPRSEHAHAR
jgi:hypothetical protein